MTSSLLGPGLRAPLGLVPGEGSWQGVLVVFVVLVLAAVAGRWWARRDRERARAHHEAWLARTMHRD